METIRQQKVSRLLQKDLSEIFQSESRNLFDGAMITVTKIRIVKDLSLAKVYLSLFCVDDKETLLVRIRKNGFNIRQALNVRVKKQLRVLPELQFYLDDSLDYIENIDNLLEP